MQKISAESFMLMRVRDPELPVLDVRTPPEFALGRLEGNVANIPLDVVNAASVAVRFPDRKGPLYVMCHTQNRASVAATRLEGEGVSDLVVIEGGYEACSAILRARKKQSQQSMEDTMAIERQVRFVAGFVVLLGFLLGLYVAPVFHWLSGLVGLGLVFSGLTGWCGIAILLKRAPWNKSCCS